MHFNFISLARDNFIKKYFNILKMLKRKNKKNLLGSIRRTYHYKEQTRGSVAFGLGLRADDQLAYKKNVSKDRLLPAVESLYLGNCILPIFTSFETLVATE